MCAGVRRRRRRGAWRGPGSRSGTAGSVVSPSNPLVSLIGTRGTRRPTSDFCRQNQECRYFGAFLVGSRAGMTTKVTEVLDELRMDIVRGRLPPGEKLRLEHLTTRYGTGRTPLREAC